MSNDRSNCYKVFLCLFLSFQSSVVLAESENEIEYLSTEQDLFANFSMTSATRLAQSPRDLPVSVTIITREMIDASSATEIPDLFRLVPGFRVGNVDGGMYTVIGQGVGDQWSKRLEVLVDGLPVQSPVINFIDWLSLPIEIDDIEYIEVMRGTSVAVYGANAFDGVINIITKKPFEDKGMYYRVLSGDPNMTSVQLKYGFQPGVSSHSVSGYFKKNTGFEDVHDNSENKKLRYIGDFNPSVNDEVELMLGFNEGFKDEQGVGLVNKERPRKVDSQQQYIRWKHNYENDNAFVLKAYHHHVDYDDLYQTSLLSEIFNVSPSVIPALFGGRPDQPVEFSVYFSESDRYGLDLQQSFVFSSLRLIIGMAFIYDDIKSKILFAETGGTTGLNKQIFSNIEWKIYNDLILNSGVMIEKTERQKGEVSPRLSLNYHANEENTVRLSAATSYRPLTAYFSGINRAARYTSDHEIIDIVDDYRSYKRPEKIISHELAHLASYPNYDFSFDWRLYKDSYIDVAEEVNDSSIVDDIGDGAGVLVDGGDYYVKGFQAQAKFEPGNIGLVAIHLSSATSKGIITTEFVPLKFKDYAEYVPSRSYGVLLSRKLVNNTSVSLNFTHVSKVLWRSDGSNVPAYDRLDLSITSKFKIGKSNAKLDLIAQNVLDEYIEFNTDNVFDTRFLLRFSIKQF